ncbi:TSUP family transporter, partial [Pseudomonas aeruginosa]|uniref:TSUP family transporter n=1 Tax=Pseudomonas aeruginosa TaxID=287 RepID=UPI003CC6D5E6
ILVALQMVLDLKPKGSREVPGKGRLTLAGAVIGWASANFGIGGGSLTVPFLSWRSVPIHHAVPTYKALGHPIAKKAA